MPFPNPGLTNTKSASRIDALDALRGCAILMVVLSHYGPGRLMPASPVLTNCLGLGGVILFFFLSGFFIDRVLSQNDDLTAYALRRVFRILPAYWFSIVVFSAISVFPGQTAYLPVDVTSNALLIQDITGAPLMTGVFWTLIVEARFYIVAPLLSRNRTSVLVGVLFGAMLLNGVFALWRGYPSNLSTYLMYCLMGMCFGRWHRGLISVRGLAVIIVLGALWTAAFHNRSPGALAIVVLMNGALIAFALKHPLEVAGFRFLGRVSYSWYLYHLAIAELLFPIIDRSVLGISPVVSTPAVAALSLFIAWLSYRFIEQPGIAFGKHLENSLTTSPNRIRY